MHAFSGQQVLELGCGAGVASLCLAARVSGLGLTGVELQAEYADLARRNAADNGHEMNVHHTDLRDLPPDVQQISFDHVIANPPYYMAGGGTRSDNVGRDAALREKTPLTDWISVATRRLKPKGYLTVIQDSERLPDLLAAIDGRLGGIKVRPLAPRVDRDAHLVILQARKGARAPFRMLAPIIMHQGRNHGADGEDYAPEINAVLRDGAALNFDPVNRK